MIPRALPLLMAGCFTIPDTVTLSGTVLAGAESSEGVAGATVASRDANVELVDQATTDMSGAFSIQVAIDQPFFLDIEAAGAVPTAFAGQVGGADITVADGTLWVRTPDDVALLEEEFAGCPALDDADEQSGIIEGVVYLGGYLAQTDSGERKITTATITAYTPDGTAHPACYLDDDGNSAPDATVTGATGRFAIFGVPSGAISVKSVYTTTDGAQVTDWFYEWLPAGGVAPLYPAWVSPPY